MSRFSRTAAFAAVLLSLTACSSLTSPSGPPANTPPSALLLLSPDSGSAPLAVRLQLGGQDADGEIVRYRIELSGASSLVIESLTPIDTLIMLAQGSYALHGVVEDDAGATARSNGTLLVTEVPNLAPVPVLEVDPVSGELPLEVTVSGGGTDPDGEIVSYSLDLDGDGVFEADSTAPLTRTRRFETAGNVWVRLRLVDDQGASARDSVLVTVTARNEPPSATLDVDDTSGDAPLAVSLDAGGSDSDGQIVRWEVDLDQGQGFQEIEAGGRLQVEYAFSEQLYLPRLRVTDNRGAQTIAEAPPIEVFRPIAPGASAASATGNAKFASLSIAPAIWADGQDRMRFTVVVRDPNGLPLSGVPVRVQSLRPPLVAPNGLALGETLTISLDEAQTNAQGIVTGGITTRTSSRVYGVPQIQFVRWDAMVEADAGHGQWRRLPDLEGLNAETVVSGSSGDGQFFVSPQGLTCTGQPVQIKVQAVRRADAPSPGQPAAGMFTEIRYSASGAPLPATPAAGYADWRTDGAGWIVFDYLPTAQTLQTIKAWVDGQPLNITTGLAVVDC